MIDCEIVAKVYCCLCGRHHEVEISLDRKALPVTDLLIDNRIGISLIGIGWERVESRVFCQMCRGRKAAS